MKFAFVLLPLTLCAALGTFACGSSEAVSEEDVTAACALRPNWQTAAPTSAASGFRHTTSSITARVGAPNHRARDQIVTEGQHAFAIGKFAYGTVDKDIKDEDVDIYLQRASLGAWSKVGTVRTTADGERAAVEGVADNGGRAYFDLGVLPVGSHRAYLHVKGDGSGAFARIEVLPRSARIVVTDVDGTQTSSENAEFAKLLQGTLPDAQPNGAKMLTAFAKKGFVPFYLTARPEWLTARTLEFLATNGYPPGPIHTSTSLIGFTGTKAAEYKSEELGLLKGKGFVPAYAFGNKPSDATAFTASGVAPATCVLLGMSDPAHGCTRVDGYAAMLPVVAKLIAKCQ